MAATVHIPHRLGTVQSASYTGTAGVITNAIGAQTYKIRVVLTSPGFIAIGAAPTATTGDHYMPADKPEYFTVTPGQKVSALQASIAGTLYVTEVS